VHQFNPSDRNRRIAKPPETQYRSDTLLDTVMVLFDQVIESF